jgi:hypothetical protein
MISCTNLYRYFNIQTTIGYQSNFIHKDVDEAPDAVIGNVKKVRNKRIKNT